MEQTNNWLGKGVVEMHSEAREAQIQLLLNEYGLTIENMRERGYILNIEERDGYDFAVLSKVAERRALPMLMTGVSASVD